MIRNIMMIVLSLYSAVLAQQAEKDMQIYDLQDTIVVVANRYQTTLKNLTYTHQVIKAAEVNKLTTHSSLEVVDMFFPSAYTLDKKIIGYGVGAEGAGSINLRGQGGKPNTGLLVLINGHPDFMGIFGHPLPDVYGNSDVRQVEIIAGPSSTVFGSQAMGGIVNINTRPDYSKLLGFSLEGGSHGTYHMGLNLSKSFSAGGFFLNARHQHTDGHIQRTGFNSFHFQGGVDIRLTETWQMNLSGRFVPYEFDDPVRGDTDPAGLGTYAKIRRGNGELILENKSDVLQGSTQLYGNWGHHRFDDGFESRDFSYGLSGYQQWKIQKDFSIAGGGDLIYYGGKAQNDLLPPGIVNDEKQELNSVGLYLLGLYSGIPKTALKVGIRYQQHSLALSNVAPVAGITYQLLSNLQLYANYQNGFRYPTLNELFLFPIANPDLKEEQVNSIEGGLRFFWAGKNVLRLSYYHNNIKNIIQAPAPPPPVPYTNSGEARQSGFETQFIYHFRPAVRIQFSYSYLDPGRITRLNPRHQLKYMLFFQQGKLEAVLSGKYIERLFAENDSQYRLNDYHVLNLYISFQMGSVKLHMRLKNILDRQYQVLPEYPAPGFHFLAGVDYQL